MFAQTLIEWNSDWDTTDYLSNLLSSQAPLNTGTEYHHLNHINNEGQVNINPKQYDNPKACPSPHGLILFNAQLQDLSNKLKDVKLMYDTGASMNYMSRTTAVKHGLNVRTDSSNAFKVKVADGTTYTTDQTVSFTLEHEDSDYSAEIECTVLDIPMEVDIILGYPWQYSLDNGLASTSLHKRALTFSVDGTTYWINTQPHLPSHLKHQSFELITSSQAQKDLDYWAEQAENLGEDLPWAYKLQYKHLDAQELNSIPAFPTEPSDEPTNVSSPLNEARREIIKSMIKDPDANHGILQSMMCKIMLENIPTEFPLGTYDKEFLTRKFNKLSEESLATVVNDQLRKLNKTTTLTPRSQRGAFEASMETDPDEVVGVFYVFEFVYM